MANIICTICRDSVFENQVSHICCIPCGHVFHECCLLLWFRRSQTCPHCRVETTSDRVSRLFFEQEYDDENGEDVNSLRLKLRNSERELEDYRNKLEQKIRENTLVSNRLKESNAKNDILSSKVKVLNEKICDITAHMGNLMKKNEELYNAFNVLYKNKQKVEAASQELDRYRRMKFLLESSYNEAKGALEGDEFDLPTLKACLVTMKRDLEASNKSQMKLKTDFGNLFNTNKQTEKMIADLKEQLSVKDRIIESVQNELKKLSSKTESLLDISMPGCSSVKSGQRNSIDIFEPSPKRLKESVRRSSYRTRFTPPEMPNKKALPTKNVVTYDGLGGRSKIEEFPTAKLRPCKIVSKRKMK